MYQESKQHFSRMKRRAGFADLLGYGALIAENTLLMKDGSLLACYQFYGDDVQSTEESIRMALSQRWSQGVATLWSDNLIIETNTIRRKVSEYTQAQSFPDVVSSIIDQERRWQFQQAGQLYESVTYVSFTWRDSKQLSKTTKKFMYESDETIRDKSPQETLREFNQKLHQFIQFVCFGQASKCRRLKGDELVSFLDSCMTGEQRQVSAPEQNLFLDAYLAKEDFVAGHEPNIGHRAIKILATDSYPNKVVPMMLHTLNTLPIEFRWHTRFILFSKRQAEKQLNTLRRTWSSKAIGMKGVLIQAFGGTPQLNESAEMKHLETKASLAENDDGELKYGFVNANFIFINKNIPELNRQVQDFKDAIQHLGFVMREEAVNATDAYLGSLPGHGGNNVRMNLLDSIAWSYMLPLSSIYCGESVCSNPLYPKNSPPLMYCLTDNTNVYRFNNFYQDVGHSLVIGPTGAGKSVSLGLMLSQHRKYKHAREIVLDKDNSQKITILAHGGQYYDTHLTDQATAVQFAPLSSIDDPFAYELALRWLADTFALNGVEIQASHLKELRAQLSALAKQPQDKRTFQNLNFQEPTLRQAWQSLNTGMFKTLMNGSTDHFLTGDCLGIDIGALLELDKHIAAPIIKAILDKLTFIFQDRRPTLLMIEEGWMFLDNPVFEKQIKDWLKTLRKFNVSVIFTSQSVTDVSESTLKHILLESCPTKIFLPNHQAITPIGKGQYQDLGLNDKEIDVIAHATPKQHYFVMQPQGKRLIDLGVGEVALAFLGVSSETNVRAFYQALDQHPNSTQWVSAYLNEKGLTEAASFVYTQYGENESKATVNSEESQ